MPIKDYYKTLGVGKDAKTDAIKSAYRKLAKEHHPDRNKGSKEAERKFAEINEAYEVLGNDENRRKYDQLTEQQRSGKYTPPQGYTSVNFDGELDWDAILGQMFGFARPGGKNSKGGDGGFAGAGGFDFSSFSRGDADDPFFGTNGVYTRTERAPVENLDITVERNIAPWDAALGGTLKVISSKNEINVKIPPNTRSGVKLRVRGQGKADRAGKRGDLYIKLTIQNPDPLPEAARDFYRRMKDK